MGQEVKDQADKKGQSRKKLYFKFFAESWLWGSSRTELKPDERSVWVDFLSLAASSYGDIEISSRRQLARQLLISMKLLNKSIDNFIKFGKVVAGSRDEKELLRIANWDEYQADYLKKPGRDAGKRDTCFSDKGKDIRNKSIGEREEEEANEPSMSASATGSGGPSEKEVSLRGSGPPPNEERDSPIVAKIVGLLKGCDIPQLAALEEGFEAVASGTFEACGLASIDMIISALALMREHPEWIDVPSEGDAGTRLLDLLNSVDAKASPKERLRAEFLAILRSWPDYPFDETWDAPFFEEVYKKHHPKVDLIFKTRKKVEFWKEHPAALSGRKSPHDQLREWFAGDYGNKKR
jgi:hypothetical protein